MTSMGPTTVIEPWRPPSELNCFEKKKKKKKNFANNLSDRLNRHIIQGLTDLFAEVFNPILYLKIIQNDTDKT